MDVKTRAALSGNSTLAILLILIMLMVTFFLVATPFMLGAVLNTQNHFNKLEKAFLIAEYSQLTDKVEYTKWVEGNLSESYELFFSLPLIELLPKAYPKVNQDIHKLKNLLLEYVYLIEDQNQSNAPPLLVDGILQLFSINESWLEKYGEKQFRMILLVNIAIIFEILLLSLLAMHLKIKKNRESNLSKGLRNLNQTNLMRIEAEKKQLRYAIHDNILQDMEMSRKYIERLRDESADHLVSDKAVLIETSIRRSISDLRRLLEGLPYWDTSSFTFKDNIVNLIEKMRTKLGPAIHLTILGVKKAPLGSHQMEQLLSILQEALNNAVEHSGAKNIFVKVLWANPVLRMSIEDDGAGLPKEKEVFETSNRMGLLGMRERAYAIGAHFKLVSAKDKGVKIDIELSMENQRE